ncbi:MAG: lamin tail domain-containing protein, partial [Bacteroidales bacterium]|nr:lamin tail domain-containing protein [Bacteroidales bacterium]
MKKYYIFLSTMMVTLIFCLSPINSANAQLYINEFLASNDVSFPGPQGDYPDWIEIYNAGSEDVMLGGYYLYDVFDLTEAIQIP